VWSATGGAVSVQTKKDFAKESLHKRLHFDVMYCIIEIGWGEKYEYQ